MDPAEKKSGKRECQQSPAWGQHVGVGVLDLLPEADHVAHVMFAPMA